MDSNILISELDGLIKNIRKKDFSKIDNWARKNRIDCLYLLSEGKTNPKIKELNNGFIHVDTK